MTLIEQPDQVVLDKDYKGEKKINVGKCQQTSEVQGPGYKVWAKIRMSIILKPSPIYKFYSIHN